jgi:hypothetical protein
LFYKLSLFSLAFGLSASVFATSLSASPTTVTVGTCLGASPYATISAAVTAVAAGSTINVCPGAYPEQILITKSLTLTGIPSGQSQNPVVQAPAGGLVTNSAKLRNGLAQAVQILVVKAANVNINNIAVDGTNSGITGCAPDLVGIKYQFSSGTLNHVVAKNQALTATLNGCQSGEGIIAESISTMSGSSTVVVTNSSVRGYQKNGIVADGSNTKVTAQFNFVTGQGPTTGAAENGIEFISGAGGLIAGNVVLDNIYSPATVGASGILIYAAPGVSISNNSIGDSQLPIATVTDSSLPNPGNLTGSADKTNIVSNVISNTPFDGIDACSNSNTISLNLIVNALESGIHLDSTCGGTGKSNTVAGNSINDACAGVLQGATPNSIGLNTTFNVQSATLAGNSCTSSRVTLLAIANAQSSTPPPSPF